MHKRTKLLERQRCSNQWCTFVACKTQPTKFIYSDASDSACGSYIQFVDKIFNKNWSDFEASQSSTFRELLAVSLSLQAFTDSLGAQSVVWYTDNQNVARIVNIGSKVPALRKMALDIHRGCLLRGMSIDMQWIPRDFNFLQTTLGRWWTTTTTRLTSRFSLLLTSVGVLTPAIDLPAITTRSVRHSIPGSTSLGHPVSTALLKTGPRPITGSAFLFV